MAGGEHGGDHGARRPRQHVGAGGIPARPAVQLGEGADEPGDPHGPARREHQPDARAPAGRATGGREAQGHDAHYVGRGQLPGYPTGGGLAPAGPASQRATASQAGPRGDATSMCPAPGTRISSQRSSPAARAASM